MSDVSTRAVLIYSAVLEDVSERRSGAPAPLGESVLARTLDYVAHHPDAANEALRVIRDMARIAGGVLVDVLGPDAAHNYLTEMLVLCETAGVLDDAAAEVSI